MTPERNACRAILRVLVIFPGALGDLICVMPTINAIARRHAGAAVELMARNELAELAAGRTVVARAHSIDAREVSALFTDGPLDDARRLFSQFDRIYSFFAADDARFREHLASATDGEVSFHRFRPDGDGHVAQAYLRAIGEVDSASSPALKPSADDLAAAARALGQARFDGSDVVVMFPGSGSHSKNWPAERFAALAAMLGETAGILRAAPSDKGAKRPGILRAAPTRENDSGAAVAIVLGPAEEALEPIFREAGVPVLKNLNLPTVAGIARTASVFVGNDSGVSHLAAAVGTSGVVIFGPSDPARWRPRACRPGQRIEICQAQPIKLVEPREVASLLSKICSASANIID
jgi:ADP-heptose:LPS heptosyltransferase